MTHTGRAEYSNPDRGDYTFEVEAIDRDLSYSRQPARVRVTVRPALGRHAMWTLLALAAGLIIWQVILIVRRNRNLRRARDELEQRVEERTAELREAMDQLVLRDKMASLGKLAAGIAHEVNNPIGAIKSAADVVGRCIGRIERALVGERSDGEEDRGEGLGQVLELLKNNNRIALTGSERISTIVQSLKDFARLDQSELLEADLRQGLDSTLTLIEHEMKGRIKVERDFGEIPTILCHANEINQVFMNLLLNALEAIDGEGEIRISTRLAGEGVRVSIADNGRGIPAADLEKVFDPGFTTKGVGVGTGLGLSISYNIARKHGGDIQVDSTPGEGTSVTLVLPLTPVRVGNG